MAGVGFGAGRPGLASVAVGDAGAPGQQIRGSCSPTSMSTIRSLPTIVRIVTMPG